MKFSLFLELQVSEPYARGGAQPNAEPALFRAAVRQAELADRLGFHAVWAVEHHGLVEYSHCSAPETLLAFIAARTQSLRLGHGVTLLPHRYNHPVRVAERIASLDLLSEGRVLWGTGKSSSPTEQRAFELRPDELEAQWQEALEAIVGMWGVGPFEYEGRFLRIPPTEIVPKPAQVPHPPIFMACSQPATAVRAAGLGLGALNFSFGTVDQIAETSQAYRAAAERVEPKAWQPTRHFAVTPPCLVLSDDREACRHGFRGARFFADGLNAYYRDWKPEPVASRLRRHDLSAAGLERQRRVRGTSEDSMNALCGDPVFVRERVAALSEAGVDEIICVMQMGTISHDLVLESVRTFGEHVIPHFS